MKCGKKSFLPPPPPGSVIGIDSDYLQCGSSGSQCTPSLHQYPPYAGDPQPGYPWNGLSCYCGARRISRTICRACGQDVVKEVGG